MKDRKSGAIVNIASTASLMGLPNRAPYVVAKFGAIGLTKTLALELGPSNIRVNAIAPGSITGDRMDRVIAAHAKAEGISEAQVREMYTQGTSMQTFVDADEIADTSFIFVPSVASTYPDRSSRWTGTRRPYIRGHRLRP